MKILLTGGSGLLGRELQNIDENIYAPTSAEMNILNIDQCDKILDEYNPDVVLHAAAFISPPRCDANPEEARNNNIIGTVNLVNLCQKEESTYDRYVSLGVLLCIKFMILCVKKHLKK